MATKQDFWKEIEEAKNIVVLGHIGPDGDCVGSCLGFYNYMKDNYPEKPVDVYLGGVKEKLAFLGGADEVLLEPQEKTYDLCLSLDCATLERLGDFAPLYESAKRTVCIDHHASNPGFGDLCYIDANASSASEMVFHFLDEAKIGQECAEALYLGMVHDTGVFKYENTSPETMQIAGTLMGKGARNRYVIEETFYKKNFTQNKMWAKALDAATLYSGGRIIVSCVTKDVFDECGATAKDTGGIADTLRSTDGVECAIWLHNCHESGEFGCSIRSNGLVDANQIAAEFGGGGHKQAAGCRIEGEKEDIIKRMVELAEAQLPPLPKEEVVIADEDLAELNEEAEKEEVKKAPTK